MTDEDVTLSCNGVKQNVLQACATARSALLLDWLSSCDRRHLDGSAIALVRFDLLHRTRAVGLQNLLNQINFCVGEVAKRVGMLDHCSTRKKRNNTGQVDFGLSFSHALDDFRAVQFKIRAQHFDGKFTELRSRAARPATESIAGLELILR